jgi:hypothetical protein
MKPTLRLLASAANAGSNNILQPAALAALLPPVPLYRRLFRAHRRYLPREMRLLGDEYIRKEFRAHREVDNPAHLVSFFLFFFSLLSHASLEEGLIRLMPNGGARVAKKKAREGEKKKPFHGLTRTQIYSGRSRSVS